MDQAELVLDYIDVLIWPLAIVAIIGIVVTKFRDEIARVILRIQTVRGPGGTEVLAPLEEQKATNVEQLPEEVAERVEEDRTTAPTEGEGQAETAEGPTEPSQLKQQLTKSQFALYYERVYRIIYGTQISLLHHMNEQRDGSTMVDTVSFFQKHVTRVKLVKPTDEANFSNYMNFLTSWGIVQFKSPSSYQITEWGRGFLTYLTSQGIPSEKPY